MHEFSIAQSVRDIALEEARRHGVTCVSAVTCRVGVLRQIVSSLLESAFAFTCEGTPLAGVELRIEVIPVEIDCSACGRVSASEDLPAGCPACGSPRIRFVGGMDMQVSSITVPDKECGHEHSGVAQRA